MMPDGAAPARASVLAEMSVMMHELETGDELADLLAAAQIFAAANRESAHILPGLGRGDVKPLFAWLDQHIRSRGCLLMPDELIETATGSGLDTAAYKASITARYLD
jgi:Zn-dependent M32 family carboxypeptidase